MNIIVKRIEAKRKVLNRCDVILDAMISNDNSDEEIMEAINNIANELIDIDRDVVLDMMSTELLLRRCDIS